jgi:hypothetical protein
MAARNAFEFLAANDRKRLHLLIARTIASGMDREEKEPVPPRISLLKLSELRGATGTSCPYTSLLKCITLRADVDPYSLSHSATNENLAFCGSWLAMAVAAGKSDDETGSTLSLPEGIINCVRTARRRIFPRSKDTLSNAQCLDIVQAILYAEFQEAGYVVAAEVFDRCISAFRKAGHASASKQFSAGVPYTQLLQEFAQQFGADLPSYYYVLTNPTKPHAPVFRCRASYGDLSAEALGNSKKLARQKASYELLKKLEARR